MYFEQLMCIAIGTDLQMGADTMHQYVIGLATFKTMMRMLYDELKKGDKLVYPDATVAKGHFQKDVTMEYVDTIIDYQDWH